jgi:hypothetical protein
MSITVEFRSVIKGYHVYKVKPKLEEELAIRSDPCPIDPLAHGIYPNHGVKVGHVPAEGQHINIVMERAQSFHEEVSMKW